MSKRSTYLRSQAEKCRWHASKIGDAETQDRLKKLAAEYIMTAADIEKGSNESHRVAAGSITSSKPFPG
jgi:hypothetical protein